MIIDLSPILLQLGLGLLYFLVQRDVDAPSEQVVEVVKSLSELPYRDSSSQLLEEFESLLDGHQTGIEHSVPSRTCFVFQEVFRGCLVPNKLRFELLDDLSIPDS